MCIMCIESLNSLNKKTLPHSEAIKCYRKKPKISDTPKFAVITLKVELDCFSLEKCTQKMQRELQTV